MHEVSEEDEMITRNFADVIRGKLAADPELASDVENARIEADAEQKAYDETEIDPCVVTIAGPMVTVQTVVR